MKECDWVACEGILLFFWHEVCFWFGCLLSLSSVCVDCYALERRCAGVRPVFASKKMEAVDRACCQ